MNRISHYSLGLLLAASSLGAFAHGGEDHGPPPLANARALLPRVTAHSDVFEIVGVLEPGRLLVYVDATPTNAPVTGASVEIEGAGANAKAAEVSPGVYEIKFAQMPAPGQHPMTFTVQAGSDTDLLGAPLAVPQPAAATTAASNGPGPHASWKAPAAWAAAGAGVTAAAMAAMSALRRRRAGPAQR